MLDEPDADKCRWLHECCECRSSQGGALADVADVARAAMYGAIDTALADIDEVVPGSLDERAGPVTIGETGPDRFGVLHEIVHHAWLANGRILAARLDGIPGRSPLAAIPRYATPLG